MTLMAYDANGMSVFLEFIDRYQYDSALMVREVFDAEPDDWQLEVLAAYDLRTRGISIRSGHGVGKSTCLSWIAIHHALCKFPQKTVLTAPTSTQLFDALWAELKSWFRKLPPALLDLYEIKADRIELKSAPEESFISVRTSRADNPEAMQGTHSENVLIVADEASGIPEQVFEAGRGSMSGDNAITILAGNPVRGSGFFYDTHTRLRGSWKTFRVSCLDSKRVSEEYAADMAATYGEDSNAYRVRVLGEFPREDDDTIIPLYLVEDAQVRNVRRVDTQAPVWGLDCARGGGDKSALAKRHGNHLLGPVETKDSGDTMEVVGWVKSEWDQTTPSMRPSAVFVDVIGIGAGVVDRLKELNLPARGINVSERPALRKEYKNQRTELWFKGRDWFAELDCWIPKGTQGMELLLAELTAVRFKFTSNGKRVAEDKNETKKRLKRSPDRADAFNLTFAGNAVTAAGGGGHRKSWKEPLEREIGGLY